MDLCTNFNKEELKTAIQTMKPAKAPRFDNLYPEFFMHLHDLCLTWFITLFSTCLSRKKVPKIWKLSMIVAVLKRNKSANEPKSYRPISLLCIPFKLFEKLIYNRIHHIIKKILPHEQAGFRHGKGTVDQVALMTNDIKHSFDEKKKVGAVFVDLTSAYDTV